jgi:predicted Abi (CAAX) family protease
MNRPAYKDKEIGATRMSHTPRPIRPIRKARDYVLSKQSELNHPAAFPLAQQLAPEYYRPMDTWPGRLVLPQRAQRRADRGVWFEVYHAPDEHQTLIGQRVWLRWSTLPQVQARVWSVTKDVLFSDRALASIEAGLVLPERLNGWLTVGPLESLAGARPVDDVVVALRGPVEVAAHGSTPADVVHVSGYYSYTCSLLRRSHARPHTRPHACPHACPHAHLTHISRIAHASLARHSRLAGMVGARHRTTTWRSTR